MRAILINPWTKEITEVAYNGDFNQMYRLLSNPLGSKVKVFTCVLELDNGDTLYVDNEGFMKKSNRVFEIKGAVFAGNGLIIGEDEACDACDAKSMLVEMQNLITWKGM